MITSGHPPESVWRYTPRQATAFATLAYRRMGRARSLDLSITRLAYHGRPDAVKKVAKEMTEGDGF